ncbi:phosphatidate cytidylyltransferase [Pseudofulvibacter geojedonensis]|uniref:Phosphatidate cytidylyltransferase n=1 Tax=Pseudofulvibacter geojedonensis TaxID=1123758 RepID=A0ABW3I5C5_9FLAO
MNETLTRALSGLVYITVFIVAIYTSQQVLTAVLFIFGGISCWELKRLLKEKSSIPYFQLIIVFGILAFSTNINTQEKTFLALAVLSLLVNSYLTYQLFTLKRLKERSFFKQILPLGYLISSISLLAITPSILGSYNPNIIFGILVIIWTNDTFAYLVGKNFGKRKLFEKISPKKTIEGFIGGMLFGVLTGCIMASFVQEIAIIHWILLSIIITTFGTIGDLVASKFKREANIKDSSNLIPGHGGFLDRLDSLLFVSPFVYLYIQLLANTL